MFDLSIVIVGYKTRGLIKNCLNSIYKNLANSDLKYSITVVDNASNDGTVEMIRSQFKDVKLIEMKENLGYSRAVNPGIQSADAKYYFVLNPDTLFLQPNSIDNLFNFMEANRKVGMVGPKLINPDGSVQMSCCRFPSFFMPIYRRTFLGKLNFFKKKIDHFLMRDWDHGKTACVDWVIGTGMFIRKDALQDVGLMDETFFMYFEDTDWCRRFWLNNWEIVYVADIEVIHYHGRQSYKSGGIRDLFFNKGTRIHIASWLKYFKKYLFNKSKINHNIMTNPTLEKKDEKKINFSSEQFDITANANSNKTKKTNLPKIIFGTLFVLIVLVVVYFLSAYLLTKKYAVQAKNNLESSYENFINFDFVQSNVGLVDSRASFDKAQKNLTRLKPLTFIDVVEKNYNAVEALMNSTEDFTYTFEIVNSWCQENIAPIRNSQGASVTQLNTEDKTRLLKAVSEIESTLEEIYSQTSEVNSQIKNIETEKVNSKVVGIIENLKGKLSLLEEKVQFAKEVLPVAVKAVGYPESQNYFFALQNNGEMRPTGGYLGTYGIFEIANAEFVEFDTYNTYHLDMDNYARLATQSPDPIRKYMLASNKYVGTSKWILRDANWSPDLPTAVQKIEELYKLESQDEIEFDGFVIIDPNPIVELLAITGPITVEDIEFNADNFVDELEAYTYEDFAEEGVASRDRKELIGDLGVEMVDYFLNSNLEKWLEVWDVVETNLYQKHIMFNFDDVESQELIYKFNWDNRVKDYNGDYLMVVDSNMGSLKTDRFTEKNIEYSINLEDNRFIAEVKLTYQNDAEVTEKSGDLRTYTRVYTPEGSELIEIVGGDTEDFYQELNKKVFGTFWTIPTKQTRELTFRYELPKELFENNDYLLYVQKQAGTQGHNFKFNIDVDCVKANYQIDLAYDEEFSIKLR